MSERHFKNDAIKALLPKFVIGLIFGYAMGLLCANLLVDFLGHYFHPAWFERLTGIQHVLIKVPLFACFSVIFLRVTGWYGVLKQISELQRAKGVSMTEKVLDVHTMQYVDKS